MENTLTSTLFCFLEELKYSIPLLGLGYIFIEDNAATSSTPIAVIE